MKRPEGARQASERREAVCHERRKWEMGNGKWAEARSSAGGASGNDSASPTTSPLPRGEPGEGSDVSRARRRRRSALVALVALAVLAGCAGDRDGVSTAGTFSDAPLPEVLFPGLAGAPLADAVDRGYSPDQTLGYARARDELYGHEQQTYGAVCGVYTDYCRAIGPGDPSIAADALGINAEHVWPQSMGADAEPLKSDLHHLFPARQQVNSSRQNLPFGEIDDADADAWYRDDLSQSNTPADGRDAWSERGAGLFEPRESRKGDVARAVFYVAAVYPDRAEPAFFRAMRDDLLAWNRADPPDDRERARSAWVASLQGSENPFVLDPGLADRIWGGATADDGPRTTDPPSPSASGAARITEFHYDNAGEDVGEGVEVEGAALDGWTLVLVNGSGGAPYRTVPLSGSGTVWVPVEGVQNGSPDGVALLDPAGRVVEALGYEGSFRGVGGATDGARFQDVGVQEGSGDALGGSLQRVGGRWVVGPASPGRPN